MISSNVYGAPPKPGEELGAVGLGAEQVVELETELLREVADRAVALVDQLAAVLGDLSVRERAAQRPAAASDPVGRLVDVGGVAGLLQAVRAGQAGEAGSDDDDARCRRGARGGREAAERRDAERAGAGAPKQVRRVVRRSSAAAASARAFWIT